MWAAIAGANTEETVQTVGAETEYEITITDPTPDNKASGDETAKSTGDIDGLDRTISLPATTWTPTGAGDMSFSEAPAGSMAPIALVGKGYRDTGYHVNPFGSIFVRAETDHYGANLDCVRGTVALADSTIRYSNFGRGTPPNGMTGRYAVTQGEVSPYATVKVNNATGGVGSKYQAVTVNVVGSPLQLDVAGQLVSLPTVKLDGTDKVTSSPIKQVKVLDPRGSASGWNVVGQLSDFKGTTAAIPANNAGWAPSAGTAPAGSEVQAGPALTDPTNPSADGLGTARTLCSSTAGVSAGSFTCDALLYLGVPGNTLKGTYTAILTLTLV